MDLNQCNKHGVAKVWGITLTIRRASLLSLLAMARICASWLKRAVEIGVVRLEIALRGLGVVSFNAEYEPEPYKFT